MKAILTAALLLFAFPSSSQPADNIAASTSHRDRSEISLLYNLGFSGRNYEIPEINGLNRLDYRDARSYYDRGLVLKYEHSVLHRGRNRFTAGAGIGFSNAKHYLLIIDYKYDYLLERVMFNSKTIDIPVLIGYEREVVREHLFMQLSCGINYGIPLNPSATYSAAVDQKYGFIDYSYTLDVSGKKQFSRWVSLTAKLKLLDHVYLQSSLCLLASKSISYNYTTRNIYHMTDQNGQTSLVSAQYYSLPSIELKDKYLYLCAGVSYRF